MAGIKKGSAALAYQKYLSEKYGSDSQPTVSIELPELTSDGWEQDQILEANGKTFVYSRAYGWELEASAQERLMQELDPQVQRERQERNEKYEEARLSAADAKRQKARQKQVADAAKLKAANELAKAKRLKAKAKAKAKLKRKTK